MDNNSKILTEEQRALIQKARQRVSAYANTKGEVKISCADCAIMYVHQLLQVIDDLQFELHQLNK